MGVETDDKDLREELEAAFDAASDDTATEPVSEEPVAEAAPAEPAEPVEATEPSAGETAEERAERIRDEKGRFAKDATPKDAKPPAAATKQPAPPKPTATVPPTTGEPSATPLKPPSSWKPGAREKWASLPPEVQAEAIRREREIEATLRETAGVKQFASQMMETIRPFEPMIRAGGQNATQAIGGLLQSAAVLATGTPTQKAALAAQIIKGYGVPIEELAAHLDGHATQAQPAVDPRIIAQQVQQQVMQGIQQQQQQARLQRATSDVEQFGGDKEFFEDVREDMADLLEVHARRGKPLTLDKAYELAVKLDPELSAVFQQRQEAERAANAKASTQRARAAASSVKSRPSGIGSPGRKDDSIRGALEAAFDEIEG